MLKIIRKLLRPLVPPVLVPYFFRGWVWVITLVEALTFRKRDAYLPSPRLRFKVAGSPDRKLYLSVGLRTKQDIENALARTDRSLKDFNNILDFGCGVGRTIRWLTDKPDDCHLYGCDVDEEAIRWSREHLDFGDFITNPPLPPTEYKDCHFDLIYLISVFTHLDEKFQLQWLEELARITKPGGIVLISVHGNHITNLKLSEEQVEQVQRQGILFYSDSFWKLYHPDFYQTCFHTPEYIHKEWSKFFHVSAHIERGINDAHDLVVLEKRT
ncbi:MAG: class I SAM-dependent methyltransferase [Candidatus Electryoneaceae bacterium]|nr:class I SAM-dependent methyltransferase [Candidatus Electryoneaceae bacterium]